LLIFFSALPWNSNPEEPFHVKEVDLATLNASVKCAGCQKELKDPSTKQPYLGLVVVRSERDYTEGSDSLSSEKAHYYHMLLSCIRRRHAKFDPRVPGQDPRLVIDGRWFASAEKDQKDLVELFRNAALY
jgi:hypothetical protein